MGQKLHFFSLSPKTAVFRTACLAYSHCIESFSSDKVSLGIFEMKNEVETDNHILISGNVTVVSRFESLMEHRGEFLITDHLNWNRFCVLQYISDRID